MNRKILYYPSIKISNMSWLRNALLYWDEVSSIIPPSHKEGLTPEMSYLKGEGIFNLTDPNELFYGDYKDLRAKFITEFTEIIEFFIKNNKIVKLKKGVRTIPIHSDKASSLVVRFLEEYELLNDRAKNNFYLFEYTTGLIYMSILAKYLSYIDKNSTIIATDKIEYENFNFNKVSESEGFPIISYSLENVLPTPREDVPLEKIIHFKRERKDNLTHFRKTLLDFEKSISTANDSKELIEYVIAFKENIETGINDLKALHKDYKMEWVTKSLTSMISKEALTMGIGSGIIFQDTIPGIIAGGLTGIIKITSAYIETKNKAIVKERDSAFSYLYRAQEEGITW